MMVTAIVVILGRTCASREDCLSQGHRCLSIRQDGCSRFHLSPQDRSEAARSKPGFSLWSPAEQGMAVPGRRDGSTRNSGPSQAPASIQASARR